MEKKNQPKTSFFIQKNSALSEENCVKCNELRSEKSKLEKVLPKVDPYIQKHFKPPIKGGRRVIKSKTSKKSKGSKKSKTSKGSKKQMGRDLKNLKVQREEYQDRKDPKEENK